MKKQESSLWALSLGISVVAFCFLIWLIYIKQTPALHTHAFDCLPLVNSILNGCSAVALTIGFMAIKRGKKAAHKASMVSAFAFSTVFLVTYIVYHAVHGDTHFMGIGVIRPIYFFVLGSHILMTVVGLPLILTTFGLALLNRFDSHKKIARWTFPIWMYISVTGVLVYVINRGWGQ